MPTAHCSVKPHTPQIMMKITHTVVALAHDDVGGLLRILVGGASTGSTAFETRVGTVALTTDLPSWPGA